jgi:hypothetical protein
MDFFQLKRSGKMNLMHSKRSGEKDLFLELMVIRFSGSSQMQEIYFSKLFQMSNSFNDEEVI